MTLRDEIERAVSSEVGHPEDGHPTACGITDAVMEVLAAHPIDMVLFCRACGKQHIDRDEGQHMGPHAGPSVWRNQPHRTHLCHGCGHRWRPADVPTNGVEAVKTKGADDDPPPITALDAKLRDLHALNDQLVKDAMIRAWAAR